MDPWILLIIAGIAAAVLLPMRLSRVDPQRARELVDRGAQLIDVRSPQEYAAAHLPGALLVPLRQLTGKKSGSFDPDQALIVYCASGARSALAARSLRRAGYAKVYDLGSISRWPSAERSAEPPPADRQEAPEATLQ